MGRCIAVFFLLLGFKVTLAQKVKHDRYYIIKSKYTVSFLQLSKDATFQLYSRYCLGRSYSVGQIIFTDTAMLLQAYNISDSILIYAIQPHKERFPSTLDAGCYYNEEGKSDTAYLVYLPGTYNQNERLSVKLKAGKAVVDNRSIYRRVSYARYARFIQWYFRA